MITMDSKAQLTVDIIAKVAQGKITIVNAVKRAVQALVKEKYFDVNLAHLRELLEDNEQI